VLLHITPRAWWEAAQAAGAYAPPSLEAEGFIHFSTLGQVIATAHRFYSGQTGLVLLEIAADRLPAEVRYEMAGNGERFPHLYAPLNLDAVGRVVPFEPGPDGTFTLPAALTP
jgi:uncharacterized protein (DUF952 family)